MEFDFGNGKKEVVDIPKESNPREIARMIGEKHGLNERNQEILAKQIELAFKKDKINSIGNGLSHSISEDFEEDDLQDMQEMDNNNAIKVPSFDVKMRDRLHADDHTTKADRWEALVEKKLREKQKSVLRTPEKSPAFGLSLVLSASNYQSQDSKCQIIIF